MMTVMYMLGGLAFFGVLARNRASALVWFVSYSLMAMLFVRYSSVGTLGTGILGVIGVVFLLGAIPMLRSNIISRFMFALASRSVPKMSATEREALEAGTVSWEGPLFRGEASASALQRTPVSSLTEEEQAFMEGPVNALCRLLDEWDITHNHTDLPPNVWQFIKDNGFFGFIIPKSYGGLGFSAYAQMCAFVKVYGRSISTATTISVPNALGPGELILKYGTDAQKDYYLPRLADGREIPCFALTGPHAGSDAASLPDTGVVCKQEIDGKTVIGIRLNWDKRYITFAPVATVIGLAFRLYDPEHLIGDKEDIGITCVLVPADTPGVTTGRRHFPLNVAFLNGPTQGKDVFVTLDALIGGKAMVGKGWKMLMECLSVGRAISLPSSASGGTQAVALATGAYTRIRSQFNQPIGKFEGIEEPLARIAGNTYMIDAALTMTAAAIDAGEKPSLAGAIVKYHTTERARQVAIDAMDIHGGKGICLGPKNYLGRGYQVAPISITVEGANILSRCLIIFGQGAIRCHPYALAEMTAVKDKDLGAFDKAIWGHLGYFLSNAVGSLYFGLTDARWVSAPKGFTRRYFQLLKRYSTHLAFMADLAMLVLGGALKRHERLSARLGDMLSHLYFISAVLKRYEADGGHKTDQVVVAWCCTLLFHEIETALQGVIDNFPNRAVRWVMKGLTRPLGLKRRYPSDKLGQSLARLMQYPNETRDRITRHAFREPLSNCPIGRLEEAFKLVCQVEGLEKKLSKAVRAKEINALTRRDQIKEAAEKGVLTPDEAKQLEQAELARLDAIAVDDFDDAELRRGVGVTSEKTTEARKEQ